MAQLPKDIGLVCGEWNPPRIFQEDFAKILRRTRIRSSLAVLGLENKAATQGAADKACKTGDLKTLKLLAKVWTYPTSKGADYACRSGNLRLLKWLHKHKVIPTLRGIRWAEAGRHINVLRFIVTVS